MPHSRWQSPFQADFRADRPAGGAGRSTRRLGGLVDQFTTRVQALESGKMRLEDENTRLTVSLQQAQGDLNAAEGRELRQRQENLELGDLLRVYVDLVR